MNQMKPTATNLTEAREQNLDVYMFPLNQRNLIENLRQVLSGIGREAIEFETEVAGYKLTVVAVAPRVGIIAPEMKKRKATVREFIQGE